MRCRVMLLACSRELAPIRSLKPVGARFTTASIRQSCMPQGVEDTQPALPQARTFGRELTFYAGDRQGWTHCPRRLDQAVSFCILAVNLLSRGQKNRRGHEFGACLDGLGQPLPRFSGCVQIELCQSCEGVPERTLWIERTKPERKVDGGQCMLRLTKVNLEATDLRM